MDTAISQESSVRHDDQASIAGVYERQAQALIERARPIGPSACVLDLGNVSGVVARILRKRLGRAAPITSLGASCDLFAARPPRGPKYAFCQVNPIGLPFQNGTFDIVFCQQTLQFAPNPAAALSEIHRVLARRGRLLLTTARPRSEQPLHDALGQVAERHLGASNDRRFSLGDANSLRILLEDAGFGEIRIETLTVPEHFKTAPVPLSALTADFDLSALSAAERDRRLALVEAEARQVLDRFATVCGYLAASSANVVSARKACPED